MSSTSSTTTAGALPSSSSSTNKKKLVYNLQTNTSVTCLSSSPAARTDGRMPRTGTTTTNKKKRLRREIKGLSNCKFYNTTLRSSVSGSTSTTSSNKRQKRTNTQEENVEEKKSKEEEEEDDDDDDDSYEYNDKKDNEMGNEDEAENENDANDDGGTICCCMANKNQLQTKIHTLEHTIREMKQTNVEELDLKEMTIQSLLDVKESLIQKQMELQNEIYELNQKMEDINPIDPLKMKETLRQEMLAEVKQNETTLEKANLINQGTIKELRKENFELQKTIQSHDVQMKKKKEKERIEEQKNGSDCIRSMKVKIKEQERLIEMMSNDKKRIVKMHEKETFELSKLQGRYDFMLKEQLKHTAESIDTSLTIEKKEAWAARNACALIQRNEEHEQTIKDLTRDKTILQIKETRLNDKLSKLQQQLNNCDVSKQSNAKTQQQPKTVETMFTKKIRERADAEHKQIQNTLKKQHREEIQKMQNQITQLQQRNLWYEMQSRQQQQQHQQQQHQQHAMMMTLPTPTPYMPYPYMFPAGTSMYGMSLYHVPPQQHQLQRQQDGAMFHDPTTDNGYNDADCARNKKENDETTIQKLRNELETMKQDKEKAIKMHLDAILALQEENKDFLQQSVDAKRKVKSITKDKETCQKENETHKITIQDLNHKLTNQKDEYQQMSSKLKKQLAEVSQQKCTAEKDYQTNLCGMEQQIKKLKKDTQQTNETHERNIQILVNERTKLRSTIVTIKQEKDKLLKLHQDAILALQQEHKNIVKQSVESEQEKHQQTLEQLERKVASITKEKESCLEEKKKHETTIRELNENLTNQKEASQQMLDRTEKQITEMIQRKCTMEEEHQRNICDMEQQIKELTKVNHETQQTNVTHETKIQSLLNANTDWKKKHEDAILAMEEKEAVCLEQTFEYQTKLREKERQISTLRDVNADAIETQKKQQRMIDTLSKEAQIANENHQKELQNLRKEFQQKHQKIVHGMHLSMRAAASSFWRQGKSMS